jgi:hypothetical protein
MILDGIKPESCNPWQLMTNIKLVFTSLKFGVYNYPHFLEILFLGGGDKIGFFTGVISNILCVHFFIFIFRRQNFAVT